MSLQAPHLDDRDFQQLVKEAVDQIKRSYPGWDDSPSNPGMVLLELFAYLTETMIYRLNRLPEKAYIEFLRLIGVKLAPPSAASVILRFTRSGATENKIDIPRGTRVTVDRSNGGAEAPVFVTARPVTIPAGEEQAEILAYHCEEVKAELVKMRRDLPGFSVQATRPPIITPTGDPLDLRVGVEVQAGEAMYQATVMKYEGKKYRIWREVPNFANLGPDRFVYMVDRQAGVITFAPAIRRKQGNEQVIEQPEALAEVPKEGREIRLWYRRGGGAEGNVAANTLTVLKDPISGLEVTNPNAATGGGDGESLENALLRGPQELHTLQRAVTARDFESLVSKKVACRAKAVTKADNWRHASPGTVEVLLVPSLPEEEPVTMQALEERQTDAARKQIEQMLDARRPLGTICEVNWARYKTVQVNAKIVVRREEDPKAIRARVLKALYETINPLQWPFGQALRASHIHKIILAEPGVLWVEEPIRLLVEEAPEKNVKAIVADFFQPKTWYAGSDETLFRSQNDGEGWETLKKFPNKEVTRIAAHPERAGHLAVVTRVPKTERSYLHISKTCGESWYNRLTMAFQINDLAWSTREGEPLLFLASNEGLYELGLSPNSNPLPIHVTDKLTRGFYAVAASKDMHGQVSVAVAAQSKQGIFLSSAEGKNGTFEHLGLHRKDIRVLEVQYDGSRSFLWAGANAIGGEEGEDSWRWELRGSQNPTGGPFGKGWRGGSCKAIAFLGTDVLSASHREGVLRLNSTARSPQWQTSDVEKAGLPRRSDQVGPFHSVESIAAAPTSSTPFVMVGGEKGLFRSQDGGETYQSASKQEFNDKVDIPPTWLFCSGKHEIDVVSEDEA